MDTLSPEQRSDRMARVRGKDTKPEMLVRRLAHGLGFRYRLHDKGLPGKPDLVFGRRQKAVFVHGCFWHRHDDPACRLARLPKSRLGFWQTKLEANRIRDRRVQMALAELGWKYLVVWECETRHTEHVKNRLRAFLNDAEAWNEGD